MCGIFGIVKSDEGPLGQLMCDAAQRLSYRGYDSVGMATIDGAGSIDLRKDVGKIGDVAQRLGFSEMRGRRGIVQLRWATFGAPSVANAQPHLDSDLTQLLIRAPLLVKEIAELVLRDYSGLNQQGA